MATTCVLSEFAIRSGEAHAGGPFWATELVPRSSGFQHTPRTSTLWSRSGITPSTGPWPTWRLMTWRSLIRLSTPPSRTPEVNRICCDPSSKGTQLHRVWLRMSGGGPAAAPRMPVLPAGRDECGDPDEFRCYGLYRRHFAHVPSSSRGARRPPHSPALAGRRYRLPRPLKRSHTRCTNHP
jgi:hypothetical protein